MGNEGSNPIRLDAEVVWKRRPYFATEAQLGRATVL